MTKDNDVDDSESSSDDFESLTNFLSGSSSMPTSTAMSMSRRSAGAGMLDLSELDPVEELPAEHLEDSP